MNQFIAVLFTGPLAVSWICLLLGAVSATLFSAYDLAGQAGAGRLKDKYPRAQRLLDRWASRWDLLRSTLLLVTMGMEVAALSFAVLALTGQPNEFPVSFEVLLLINVAVFLLALELIPRALSESYADRLAVTFLPVTSVLTLLLFPLAWGLARLEGFLVERFRAGSDEDDRPSMEDEIRSIVEQADEEDIEEEEKALLKSVFDFGDMVAREIMTPRVDMKGIEDLLRIEEAATYVRESPHSRFPVFHETMDEIRGTIHVKDLLNAVSRDRGADPIAALANAAVFVPESMPIDDLLHLMRNEQTHIAFVVDEYGGTAGLVTMEDIIEELLGDIQDEHDAEAKDLQQLSDGSILLEAKIPVYEANERLELSIPESDEYDSIGGYIFQALGHIPRPGEVVEGPGFTLTIQSANAHRIQTVRIQRTPGETSG